MRLRSSILGHDAIYDKQYYDEVEVSAIMSAKPIATSLVAYYHPKSVVDVGCGTGALLEAFRTEGVEVAGLEYSEAGLKSFAQMLDDAGVLSEYSGRELVFST